MDGWGVQTSPALTGIPSHEIYSEAKNNHRRSSASAQDASVWGKGARVGYVNGVKAAPLGALVAVWGASGTPLMSCVCVFVKGIHVRVHGNMGAPCWCSAVQHEHACFVWSWERKSSRQAGVVMFDNSNFRLNSSKRKAFFFFSPHKRSNKGKPI